MTVYALLIESAELCFAFVYSTVCLSWIDSKPESNVAKLNKCLKFLYLTRPVFKPASAGDPVGIQYHNGELISTARLAPRLGTIQDRDGQTTELHNRRTAYTVLCTTSGR